MKKTILIFLILIFAFQPLWSQEGIQKLIHGKIIASSASVIGIDVVNLVNEKATITDSNGEFYILAKAEDLLVFSAVHLDFKRKIIEDKDLKSDVIIVNMTAKSIELEEVIVNKHPEINAVSMGILQQEAKHYTPAERKLKTAGDFKPIHLLGLLGGSLDVDAVLNAINGRTKRLKKEVKIEKKEFLLKQLKELYDDSYFVENLKIPLVYVNGFQYYIIENKKFVETLKTKNEAITALVMGELAVEYNKMIACETE